VDKASTHGNYTKKLKQGGSDGTSIGYDATVAITFYYGERGGGDGVVIQPLSLSLAMAMAMIMAPFGAA
tara:strand:+ start:202 stop:408 length:207 start_codon:yes stop_codon:yes gene_type:complete